MPSVALCLENFGRYAGGAEAYAIALAESFIARGWQVHLLGLSWDGVPEGAVFHAMSLPRLAPAWLKILLFARQHEQMVKELDVDVILGFGNTIYMDVYQSHGGVHRYSTIRKTFYIRSHLLRLAKRLLIFFSLKDKARAWVEGAPFRMQKSPEVIAISQMVVDDFVSYYGFPASKIRLIYNGIDLHRFTPAVRESLRGPLRQQWGCAEEQVVFLFLSYTLRKKGIVPLIEAAARLKEQGHEERFKVIVVGKEPQKALRMMVRRLGLGREILFFGPTREPLNYFANSDVFVLPTYYDTCSLVTLEAMACGLPVITSQYNGASGVITAGRDGHILSHPPSAGELCRFMSHYLDPSVLAQMAAQASQTACNYSAQANHEQMIEVCSQVAEQKGKQR